MDRWKKISLEALKQSSRIFKMELREPLAMKKVLPSFNGAEFFFLNEFGGKAPSDSIGKYVREHSGEGLVRIFVGPESGWSDDEISSMKEAGGTPVSLGESILRAETASLCIASYLMVLIEEM